LHPAGTDLLGLAAIEYKQKHRAFPPDLEVLGVQDLVDPFTGKQFFYSPEAIGFLFHSEGPVSSLMTEAVNTTTKRKQATVCGAAKEVLVPRRRYQVD
jgi:hypothetical protein